eukprot:2456080-Prymnesium_polylepis.1
MHHIPLTRHIEVRGESRAPIELRAADEVANADALVQESHNAGNHTQLGSTHAFDSSGANGSTTRHVLHTVSGDSALSST